jgi:hypothetical protein
MDQDLSWVRLKISYSSLKNVKVRNHGQPATKLVPLGCLNSNLVRVGSQDPRKFSKGSLVARKENLARVASE